jgi:hypothetical protein
LNQWLAVFLLPRKVVKYRLRPLADCAKSRHHWKRLAHAATFYIPSKNKVARGIQRQVLHRLGTPDCLRIVKAPERSGEYSESASRQMLTHA